MHIYSFLGLGIDHERRGIPCQDAVGFCRIAGGINVAVLSDGAGSATYAEEAAHETIEAIQDFFAQFSPQPSLSRQIRPEMLLDDLRARLIERSHELGCADPAQMSATAMFAVVTQNELLLGHLGNGEQFVLDTDGNLLLHTGTQWSLQRKPAFGIDSNAFEHIQWRTFDLTKDRIALVLMMSDGSAEMFQNRGQGDSAETVRELFRYIRDGQLSSGEDLADALDQMAEVTTEREDDWSVLVLSFFRNDVRFDLPVRPVSMLAQEYQKYFPQNTDNRTEVL